ncbi:MAG: Stp1/IreP family PP2C-type Ser/Thr phosphatase [Bdellovibrionota bacterium]
MESIKINVVGKSDIGRKRSNNQDSFLVAPHLSLFAVADGMGGHSGGEVASAMAVKTLERAFTEKPDGAMDKKLFEAAQMANQVIFEQSQKDMSLRGMGTTLTAAAIQWPWMFITQVGDSRCYLFRDGELFQLTEDHSQYYELLRAGMIQEIESHGVQKNVITRSVGYEKNVNVDLYARKIERGDRYLICSDGLTGMVSNEQITQILQNFDVNQAVQNLVELANLQGGEDNISVVVFDIE